jgi:hypothetical protein
MMIVTPTHFSGLGKDGDFAWMRKQPKHALSLFIFNDNEMQFDAYLAGHASGFTAGAGNAIARPWRLLDPPQSAGIPTGKNGRGYTMLDAHAKSKIDEAFAVIESFVANNNYQQLIFSSDSTFKTLGTGTFIVSNDVRTYIFEKMIAFGTQDN